MLSSKLDIFNKYFISYLTVCAAESQAWNPTASALLNQILMDIHPRKKKMKQCVFTKPYNLCVISK